MKKQNISSQETSYRDLIKQFVKEEIKSMLEQEDEKPTEDIKKSKCKLSGFPQVVCDCGKDITKLSKQQLDMHNRSKLHLNNI
jgi:hypothetical protein